MIHERFLKPYNPSEHEEALYAGWEASGYFNPDNLEKADREAFTIIMPPPNANGSLHVGHALFVTLQDLLVRFKRMRGYKALWLPGADHAGFETQLVYEKKLEKEGRSRFKMTREEFYAEVLTFTKENKAFMEGQLRRLGASCDWSREQFTLDPHIVKTVYGTFKKLCDDGLVYRGVRPVNWSTKYQTSLSDLETKTVERTDPLYYMKYGPFTIATVRPETKFGDTAVAVNPKDARYTEWVGKTIEFEGLAGMVKLKVIADEYVDPEFGTGVVKITPAHDKNDFEVAKRHGLPAVEVIDRFGKLNERCGKYAGMKVSEARKAVVAELSQRGMMERVDESYTHNVIVNYKNENDILEPRIMPQWFVKMRPLADKAREAVEEGRIRFFPDFQKKVFFHWLENIEDWNISRQIAWGIPIPAWFKGQEVTISEESPGDGWVQDLDTFDTWFSSGQWPFATLGYPDGKDFKTFYPTSVMETGYDILFFWVMRMIMLGLYRTGEVPFRDVYLHGLVRDAERQKMSKSKGNVINPLEMCEKYGTDALRLAFIMNSTPGMDMSLSEDKIRAQKHFANKLWNIARFVLTATNGARPTKPPLVLPEHQAYIDEWESTIADVTLDIESYRLHLGAEKLYHYTWSRFADVILEESKETLRGSDPKASASIQWTLYTILEHLLKALHPFAPFVTEAIWSQMPNTSGLLMVERWPTQ